MQSDWNGPITFNVIVILWCSGTVVVCDTGKEVVFRIQMIKLWIISKRILLGPFQTYWLVILQRSFQIQVVFSSIHI